MRPQKAAEYADVCRPKVFYWLKEGLPHAKVNGTTLIEDRALDEWVRSHAVTQDRAVRLTDEVMRGL